MKIVSSASRTLLELCTRQLLVFRKLFKSHSIEISWVSVELERIGHKLFINFEGSPYAVESRAAGCFLLTCLATNPAVLEYTVSAIE